MLSVELPHQEASPTVKTVEVGSVLFQAIEFVTGVFDVSNVRYLVAPRGE